MVDGANAPLIRREDRDGVAVLLLNRPRQRNALRYESWTELSAVLNDVVADGARAWSLPARTDSSAPEVI